MTQDMTPEGVAEMLEGVTPGPWAYNTHREVGPLHTGDDQAYGMICDAVCEVNFDADHLGNARFISWAREAVPALAAKLAEVERDRDGLRAAKWAEKHTDTMNGMVQMGMARDEAMARAEAAETEVARLRAELADARSVHGAAKVLANAENHSLKPCAKALQVEFAVTGVNWKVYLRAFRAALAALQPKDADHE